MTCLNYSLSTFCQSSQRRAFRQLGGALLIDIAPRQLSLSGAVAAHGHLGDPAAQHHPARLRLPHGGHEVQARRPGGVGVGRGRQGTDEDGD
jgi:hypothetical protein